MLAARARISAGLAENLDDLIVVIVGHSWRRCATRGWRRCRARCWRRSAAALCRRRNGLRLRQAVVGLKHGATAAREIRRILLQARHDAVHVGNLVAAEPP